MVATGRDLAEGAVMEYLTAKQRRVYEFLKAELAAKGHGPTFQEIATRFGWRSLGTSAKFVAILESRGYIVRTKATSRSIRLVDAAGRCPACNQPLPDRRAYRKVTDADHD